ncbi:META domain-containing protein [Flavobacterium cerinum]|uniref:META domain-containing protein n=1 Tax=Flavobacterium cerinum TaxID=2502784 RepID=A0ABY5IN06_9FLAO|nr:META domain-containing protein [Flavobacterium cerinum]UUC44221.1 META domain-containing protein [Flavobacterium cerinum]
MKKIALIFAVTLMGVLAGCNCTKKTVAYDAMIGTGWELEYITGVRIAFEGLYPNQKPQLTFTKTGEANGNSSCNPFSTKYTTKEPNSITIEAPKAMTMRFCEGEGEKRFLEMMQKVNKYDVTPDGKLVLLMDDIVAMRFKKKN